MEIKQLFNLYAQSGRVVSISVRPERAKPVQLVNSVNAQKNKGLEGDRSKGGNRQVSANALPAPRTITSKPTKTRFRRHEKNKGGNFTKANFGQRNSSNQINV